VLLLILPSVALHHQPKTTQFHNLFGGVKMTDRVHWEKVVDGWLFAQNIGGMSEDQGTAIMSFGTGTIKTYYPPDTECDFGYLIRMNDGQELVIFGVSDDGLSIDSISCTGVDDASRDAWFLAWDAARKKAE
jgi:hypothetical protein